jgi:hypothetical protein
MKHCVEGEERWSLERRVGGFGCCWGVRLGVAVV